MGRVAIAFLLGHCCHPLPAAPARSGTGPSACSPRLSCWAASGDSNWSRSSSRGWAGRCQLHLALGGRLAAGAGRARSASARLRGVGAERRRQRFAIRARCHGAARRRLAAASPRLVSSDERAARRRAVAARRATQAAQRFCESGRRGPRSPAVSRRDRRNRLCPRRCAQRTARAAVIALRSHTHARLDLRSHSRRGPRRTNARCSAGPRGRRYAGDEPAAVACVRRDRDDAPDGNFRPAYQHGRGARRMAGRCDRAAAVGAGASLERHARPGHRRRVGGAPVFSARRNVGADTADAADARDLLRVALVPAQPHSHSHARLVSRRRAAHRSVRAAGARSVAVVRRSRDHIARRRGARAARRADHRVRTRSGRGDGRPRATAARGLRRCLADIAARECDRDSTVHAARRSSGAPRSVRRIRVGAGRRMGARGTGCATAVDVAVAAMAGRAAAGALVFPAALRCGVLRARRGRAVARDAGNLADAPGGRAAVSARAPASNPRSGCR